MAGRRPVGRPGLSGTNTISAQAVAGTGAELGNKALTFNNT